MRISRNFPYCAAVVLFLLIALCNEGGTDAMSISNALPESLREKLSVNVELRSRFELRDNFDFDDATDDEDGSYLFRTRINLDAQILTLTLTSTYAGTSNFWRDTPISLREIS